MLAFTSKSALSVPEKKHFVYCLGAFVYLKELIFDRTI
jgi:hypothetical protein